MVRKAEWRVWGGLVAVALLAACGCTAPVGEPVPAPVPGPAVVAPESREPSGPTSAGTPSAAPSVPSAPGSPAKKSAAASAPAAKSSSASKPSTPKPSTSKPATSKKLAGTVIVVDPGHNAKYTSANKKLVPAGNGKKKACNSSGTATNSGWPEHTYTWLQANALATELRALGATVILTRPNDKGQGPCVNVRADTANKAKADAMVSIHADGNLKKGARGFHVIYSTAMAGGKSVEKKSKTFAVDARDALQAGTSMPRSTYIGKGTALSPRSDLGTLNLLKKTPGIMLEMGNMRNATDAKLLHSSAFRTKVAKALAASVVKILG